MPQDVERILKLIDELRYKLHTTGNDAKKLTDPEVLEASQQLNEALNEYYRLLKAKEREYRH